MKAGKMDLRSSLDSKFRILVLILLCSITDSESALTVNVTCHEQMICALRDSTVHFTCSYQNLNIRTGFWFSSKQKAKWRSQDHPEDLTLDQDYAGRTRYTQVTSVSSILRITDLRLEDSGTYFFILITEGGEKYFSSDGVTLEVTELQVRYLRQSHELSCQASCPPSLHMAHWYFWMKNGQHHSTSLESNLRLKNNETGSFSCAVRVFSLTDVFSDSLCFMSKSCWNVEYSDRRVCVLEGSSLDLPGFFSYPADKLLQNVYWNYIKSRHSQENLTFQEQFIHRAHYIYDKDSCRLKIRSLMKNDSGEYHIQMLTSDTFQYSGRPGVVVSVTDLQVKATLSSPENLTEVMLTCSTSCTLPQNTTFIWYKNGKLVTDKLTRYNKLYLDCAEDEGEYSCAVRGWEDRPSPANSVKSCLKGQKKSSNWLIPTIVGVAAVGVLISVALVAEIRRKQRAKRPEDVQNGSPEDRTYASLNPMYISADYSTLAEVRAAPVYVNRMVIPVGRLPDYENTRV